MRIWYWWLREGSKCSSKSKMDYCNPISIIMCWHKGKQSKHIKGMEIWCQKLDAYPFGFNDLLNIWLCASSMNESKLIYSAWQVCLVTGLKMFFYSFGSPPKSGFSHLPPQAMFFHNSLLQYTNAFFGISKCTMQKLYCDLRSWRNFMKCSTKQSHWFIVYCTVFQNFICFILKIGHLRIETTQLHSHWLTYPTPSWACISPPSTRNGLYSLYSSLLCSR
jgi:hypothetical protein